MLQRYPDEFETPESVVSRYRTLVNENQKLKHTQACQEEQIESLTEQHFQYNSAQTIAQVKLVNSIASSQRELEALEILRDRTTQLNDEAQTSQRQQTTAEGQTLMTINNLYAKVSQPELWQIVQFAAKKEEGQEEVMPQWWKREFEVGQAAEELTQQQLQVIEQFGNSYRRLKDEVAARDKERKLNQQSSSQMPPKM